MKKVRNYLLAILGTSCLNTISAGYGADYSNESKAYNRATSSESISESDEETTIEYTEPKLVTELKSIFKKEISATHEGDNVLTLGIGLSSIKLYNASLIWIGIPESWNTYIFDEKTDNSISDGIITLGELKKRALNLETNYAELLLKCYFYSKFDLRITDPNIQIEFKKLLELFSAVYPEICSQLHEKAILKNILGFPIDDKEILEVYNLLQKNASKEEALEDVSNRLKELPFCFIASFEKEYKKNKEISKEENSFFKPLKNEGTPLEQSLKKFASNIKIPKIWHDILYDQSSLLSSDYDQVRDPAVLDGTITLGELKKRVLNGKYTDFEILILAYKENRFKLPKEDYIAQEATEWLAFFTTALNNNSEYYLCIDLYSKALVENWFGKVCRLSPGENEVNILTIAAQRKNLAAIGLLHLPPFSNLADLRKKIDSGKKMSVSEKKHNEDCIIS